MFELLPTNVRNFIDAIFAPPLSFLTLMSDMLTHAALVAGRGINLNNYFGFFGYLPASWQTVVQSALTAIILLAILFLVRAAWDMFLKVKGSLKWW